MLDEQKIVFDCSYDAVMTKKNAASIVRQVIKAYGDNRKDFEPFDMHLCNFNANARLSKILLRQMPNLLRSTMECHAENVTELFPTQNMVYLSPSSPNVLDIYNPEDTYVIGALIEKNNEQGLGSARAKRLGIRSAWFPLHQHFSWGQADKGLPLNVVVDILLILRRTGDWKEAFKCIPKRKFSATRAPRTLRDVTGSGAMFGLRNEYSHASRSDAKRHEQRNDSFNNENSDYIKKNPFR